ncbi:MAG: PIN domain-containing protein [Clostridiales bacterium]|nr:PIN domain-containing protein [Clostridiales bacterium]
MEKYYLVDFENVHNEGIIDIDKLSKDDHVHIFSTQNALNIRKDVFWLNIDIKSHLVPVRSQSLDMHLVSYLGYLLGVYGNRCSYTIVSKDKDYDNIIDFWIREGYENVSREKSISVPIDENNKIITTSTDEKNSEKSSSTPKNVNGKITEWMQNKLSGPERTKLNIFIQHNLKNLGYDSKKLNSICKVVIAHCNDERMLSEIHNELKKEWDDYSKIYEDIKQILNKYINEKDNKRKDESDIDKKEQQIRTFFGQNFKEKIYIEHKEEIISIIINAKSKQQVNNDLLKLYANGNVVKNIYKTIKPLIKGIPGK